MNRSRLTLIDVLQPRSYAATPERSRVTRTIVQPEIDSFEQMENVAAVSAINDRSVKKSAPAGRHAAAVETRFAAA